MSQSQKSMHNFQIGDFVFAKVKGFTAWPSKIIDIKKNIYTVYFYGSAEMGFVKKNELFPYLIYKEEFNSKKNMARLRYRESIVEIEEALNGNDIELQPKVDPPVIETKPKPKKTKAASTAAAKLKDKKPIVKEYMETFDEPETIIPISAQKEKKKKLLKPKKESGPATYVTTMPIKGQLDDDSEMSDSSQEVLSRSGRKIKPKIRYLEPQIEKTSQKRKEYSDTNAGSAKIHKFPDLEPSDPAQYLQYEMNDTLKTEMKLLQLDHEIKSTAQLQSADPDKCINLLTGYKNIPVTAFLLKKHPHCVETIKRLRGYVGNLQHWQYTAADVQSFNKKAEKVRKIAESVYDMFKALFNYPVDTRFWDTFNNDVSEFRSKIKDLTVLEYNALVMEPKCTLRSNGRIVDENVNVSSQRKRGRKMKVVSVTDDDEMNHEDNSIVDINIDEKINMDANVMPPPNNKPLGKRIL